MPLYLALFAGAICCAIFAARSKPLAAALWLAALSALSAVLLYLYGAPEIAVIELSVGAGLITVLLAFAISMAEDESMPVPLLPRPFAWLLVLLACGLLLWLVLPQIPFVQASAQADAPFFIQVWENRLLDLMVQIAIVISGVIGVLSLIGETRKSIEAEPEVQS
jgi:uncharacterized MnhB-related membrane protein